MKKPTIFLLFACLCFSAFFLSACAEEKGEALQGTATVVLDRGGEDGYAVFSLSLAEAGLTAADSAIDVLDALQAAGDFYYEGDAGPYGVSLSEMGKTEDGAKIPLLSPQGREYIAIYTSVEEEGNPDPDSYGGTAEYDGIQVFYAMLGISSLSIESGVVYYFAVEAY